MTDVIDEQADRLATQVTEAQAQKTLRLEASRLLAATGQLTAAGLKLADPYDPAIHHDDVAPTWVSLGEENSGE